MTLRTAQHTLLPPNATQLEHYLEVVAEQRIDPLDPSPISTLWNAQTCPAPLLPWLAWAYGVDVWNTNWPDHIKRNVIDNALYIHQHRGTLAAVERAIRAVGYNITIVEWFDDTNAVPYTFKAVVDISTQGIDNDVYITTEQLINAAKNVRSHLTAITAQAQLYGDIYAGGATNCGDTVIINGDIPTTTTTYATAQLTVIAIIEVTVSTLYLGASA